MPLLKIDTPSNDSVKLQPVVKWPGGKRQLLPEILQHVPASYNRYFEPFFGGGALFFSLKPEQAFLGDLNEELVNFYLQLTQHCGEIIKQVKRLRKDPESYYRIRQSRPRSSLGKAVRFFYLNRTCFNGLYRINKCGNFNVPFGGGKRTILNNVENLQAASKLLRKVTIVCRDFERTCSEVKGGDFVYFDPPYTVTHDNNAFLKYNSTIFSWDDQLRLRDLVLNLSERGAKVVVTNAAHSSIEKLYRGFNIFRARRMSLLSAKSCARRSVSELIVTNF